MALAEKQLADTIVDWRQQEFTGSGYVPITDAIDVAVMALEALQAARAALAANSESEGAGGSADRQVGDG